MGNVLNHGVAKRVRIACSMLAAVMFCGSAQGAEVTDYSISVAPNSTQVQAGGRAISKFKYTFGGPARWQGPLHWRYNPANAPASFASNKAAVVQQLVAESAKWTAACGVQIAYDGETDVSPKNLSGGGPDGVNVIGWQKPDMGISGATYSWYQTTTSGDRALVDADTMLDPAYVTTPTQLSTTSSHEWGHAIGLAHSNVEKTLMSGPPDSMYTNYTQLAADDVHGCRCLYGPPAGQSAGNVCSLPDTIDFGTVTVGTTSAENQVTVNNDGDAPLQITGMSFGGNEFAVGSNQCAGATLSPGASCTFGIVARVAGTGDRTDEVSINTSEGPFRIPLDAVGVAAPQQQQLPNYEGVWVNAPAGSESGWGITLSHQSDVIFATWFTYDSAGRPWWLSMTANRLADNAYAGTLYETRGPAFDSVPFDPSAVTYTSVGSATLTFTDVNNGTLSYVVNGIAQTKKIMRMVFASLPVCTPAPPASIATATNYQDVWWSSAGTGESGWGVVFVHQGDTIFAAWFTYDFDGTPLWLTATAQKVAPGIYNGTLIRTTGPSFDSVPFNPLQVVRTPVGTLSLTFGDGDQATFAYTVTMGTPAVTVSQSKQLSRLVLRAPGTVCH